MIDRTIETPSDNHTYTMRLTNDTYLPVAFLEAEMEDMYEYDYEECDNCVWSECDNYLIRSTIADMDDDSDILATISDCYDYDEDIIEEDYVSPYYNGTLPHLPKKLPRRVQTFTDLTGIVFDNKNKETFEVFIIIINQSLIEILSIILIPLRFTACHHVSRK